MSEWIKISDENGGTYGLSASPDPTKIITIAELQSQIDELNAQQEPTDDELIELGRSMHPYYMDREIRIQELQKQISELEAIE